MNKPKKRIVLLTFGVEDCSVRPKLDQLSDECGAGWRHFSIPARWYMHVMEVVEPAVWRINKMPAQEAPHEVSDGIYTEAWEREPVLLRYMLALQKYASAMQQGYNEGDLPRDIVDITAELQDARDDFERMIGDDVPNMNIPK